MSSNTDTQKANGSGASSKPAYRSNKSTRTQASKANGGNRTQKRQKQQAVAEPQAADDERNGNVSKAVRQQVNQFKAVFPQWNGATLQDVLQLFAECGNDFNAACDAVIGGTYSSSLLFSPSLSATSISHRKSLRSGAAPLPRRFSPEVPTLLFVCGL